MTAANSYQNAASRRWGDHRPWSPSVCSCPKSLLLKCPSCGKENSDPHFDRCPECIERTSRQIQAEIDEDDFLADDPADGSFLLKYEEGEESERHEERIDPVIESSRTSLQEFSPRQQAELDAGVKPRKAYKNRRGRDKARKHEEKKKLEADVETERTFYQRDDDDNDDEAKEPQPSSSQVKSVSTQDKSDTSAADAEKNASKDASTHQRSEGTTTEKPSTSIDDIPESMSGSDEADQPKRSRKVATSNIIEATEEQIAAGNEAERSAASSAVTVRTLRQFTAPLPMQDVLQENPTTSLKRVSIEKGKLFIDAVRAVTPVSSPRSTSPLLSAASTSLEVAPSNQFHISQVQ